jgi:hypothetical protein
MSGVLEKLKGIIGSLVGTPTLPKTVRNTLKKYGDAKITRITINRAPISNVAEGLLTAVTLGKWKEIRQNYDKIYHLYAILYTEKGPLLLEKNETVVLREGEPKKEKGNEAMNVPMARPIPLAEFIDKTIKRMSLRDYTTYDGFTLNCQDFIKNHLLANRLLNPSILSFVYQDTQELIEKTPSFSRWLGKKITDIAGKGRELWEEIAYKKGGKVRRIGAL